MAFSIWCSKYCRSRPRCNGLFWWRKADRRDHRYNSTDAAFGRRQPTLSAPLVRLARHIVQELDPLDCLAKQPDLGGDRAAARGGQDTRNGRAGMPGRWLLSRCTLRLYGVALPALRSSAIYWSTRRVTSDRLTRRSIFGLVRSARIK